MLTFRPATKDDATDLYVWRNDETTRQMSKNTEPVNWQDHVNWLDARLSRENPALFIAETNGKKVGTFRIDGDEISYTINQAQRGRGYCTAMLKEAYKSFGPLRAEIFKRNTRSIAAANAAGMIVEIID